MKNILFITGTRADYGKIKPLMKEISKTEQYQLLIFVTGMHMLSKYGSTHLELEKDGFRNLYKYINQTESTSMDLVLSNTILGISNYINENKVDLIVVHGDRVEALAGAIVGAFNNIRVAHVEGGEVSGTIDESIRHAITKFSHLHFVTNETAKRRLIQLGEISDNIYAIGSPDIDIMLSQQLPSIDDSKKRYGIQFENYAILMYHPVTTELEKIKANIKEVVDYIDSSEDNYIVVYPNNDSGSSDIINEFARLHNRNNVRIFPSIKFEYFLTLLKNSSYMIGNSSSGVMEAGIYQIPTIDIGSRQRGRYNDKASHIVHCFERKEDIIEAVEKAKLLKETLSTKHYEHGDGKSSQRFMDIIGKDLIWECEIQKKFIDVG